MSGIKSFDSIRVAEVNNRVTTGPRLRHGTNTCKECNQAHVSFPWNSKLLERIRPPGLSQLSVFQVLQKYFSRRYQRDNHQIRRWLAATGCTQMNGA
jgi:hypothetical protein